MIPNSQEGEVGGHATDTAMAGDWNYKVIYLEPPPGDSGVIYEGRCWAQDQIEPDWQKYVREDVAARLRRERDEAVEMVGRLVTEAEVLEAWAEIAIVEYLDDPGEPAPEDIEETAKDAEWWDAKEMAQSQLHYARRALADAREMLGDE